MTALKHNAAKRIVNALLANLEGRGGFDIINLIMDDEETYKEMYYSLLEDTVEAADSNVDCTKDRFHPRIESDAPTETT